VREAEWVGNRRWNLTFKTGQVLALPEGEGTSRQGLMTFARLDGATACSAARSWRSTCARRTGSTCACPGA
jgi:hypothetical protein